MRKFPAFLLMLALSGTAAAGGDGLVRKQSANSVGDTVDKLEKIVKDKGFKVVARVNHAKAAKSVDKSLRPTELLIFGNPNVGTLLMQSSQSIGLDLPVKVLVFEDAGGQVWMVYNDPQHLVDRHGIGDRAKVVAKMTGALGKFTDAAGKP